MSTLDPIPSARAEALRAHLDSTAPDEGTVSVWLGATDGSAWVTRDADTAHYAASTMKLPLVLAAQRRVVRGELDPDGRHRVHGDFASVLDGSTFHLDESDDQDPWTWARVGGTATLAELCDRSITESSNIATNLLIDVVGLDEVAEVLRIVGCSPATAVRRGIEDAAARAAGITNTVTAADLGRLMAAVARHDEGLGGVAVTEPVLRLLERQRHLDQIPAGLPEGTPTASKSGWIPGVSHDVALVRPAGEPAFVLAVCTTVDLPEHDAAALVAAVARGVWAALHGDVLAGPVAADDHPATAPEVAR